MVNYILNGTEVPAFPTVDTSKYPHALALDVTALKTDDFNYDYTVIFCSTPFVYGIGLLDGEVVEMICRPTSSDVLAYACKTTSTSWTKVSLTSSGDTTTVEYITIPVGSIYVWTSHDIINKDTGEVQYKATAIEQHVFAATPTISSNLDNTKEYIYYQGEYATSFKINASSSDLSTGGVLTYQWYVVEDGVSKSINGALSNIYMPDTYKLGTYQYYCVVTNTYEEYTAQTTSMVVTVIVRTIESVVPQKTNFDQQSASHGWIIGKVLQHIIRMDSEADEATLVNGVLHLFDGQATLTDNVLEVT